MPTDKGRFRVRAYRDTETGAEPLAILEGEVENREGVLCRVHDQCMTSEVFGSVKCDCKQQARLRTHHLQSERDRRAYLPSPGRSGHRHRKQSRSVRAAGEGTRYRGRQQGIRPPR